MPKNPPGLGTIGRLQVRPNSSNVHIRRGFFLTVDFRHAQDRILDSMESALQSAVQDLIQNIGLRLNRILNCPPVVFDVSCVAAVRTGVEKERLAGTRNCLWSRTRRCVRIEGRTDFHDLCSVRRRSQP